MKTEQVIADAEVAACFFRALIDKGVPTFAAVSITSSYLSGKMISDRSGEKPKEPWEGDANG